MYFGCAFINIFAKGGADLVSACKVHKKMLERNVIDFDDDRV